MAGSSVADNTTRGSGLSGGAADIWTDYDFGSKENADKYRANDLKVAEAGAPMTFRETVDFPDGPRTYISHKFPVSNIEGSSDAVGGISIDITEVE